MSPAANAQTTHPRRLVILAQFDPDHGLPAHVRIHLERIRSVCDRLVLVSNSPMDDVSYAAAQARCDHVILRDNIGWDFAAWRDALAEEDASLWDSIILTNSSIVGPLFSLEPIILKMEQRPMDFWGMVHSKHRGSHLQSYFLSFSNSVIMSDAWRNFWNNVGDIADKREVVVQYEGALTNLLVKAGFRYEPLIANPRFPRSIRMVCVRRNRNQLRVPFDINYVNRTVRNHRELIEEGMPYLKASLLWGKDVMLCEPIETIKRIDGVNYPWAEIGV